jgi:hypothetical protein
MVKTEKITIKRRNCYKLKLYTELGYNVNDDEFVIDITHLNKGSRINISVLCDNCNISKEMPYKDYNRFNTYPKYTCPKCKRKETNVNRYGKEYVGAVEEFKEKTKKTNLEKYGFEYPNKSKGVKDRIKETNLERYGVDNTFKSSVIKNRIKETNLERYGFEYYSKTDEYNDKVKSTTLERYGAEHYSRTIEYKTRTESTNLERYGVTNPMMLRENKDKVRDTFNERYGGFTLNSEVLINKVKCTNLERYGVEYYSKTDEYKNKVKSTNLERWGNEYYTKTDDYKVKSRKTFHNNWDANHTHLSSLYRKNNFKIDNDGSFIEYVGESMSRFKCDLGHNFEISCTNFTDRKKNNIPLCTVCHPIGNSTSLKEIELYDYINSIYNGKIIQSYRDGLEIDIYLPELNLGFEFNGIYWHCDKYKDKYYHINKTKHFKDKGIRIIHIWEDDWVDRKYIIKSQVRNWLGLVRSKIWGRKCEIKEVDYNISSLFLEKNHIQGSNKSSLKVGLYHEGVLVSLMCFDHFEGRKKMLDNHWNISRFCNSLDTSVVGGASKLFKYFIRKYSPERVVSYSDLDWSQGDIYYKLDFSMVKIIKPDYKYLVGKERKHKSNFRKSRTSISESKLDLHKIWDCGKYKFEINLKNK